MARRPYARGHCAAPRGAAGEFFENKAHSYGTTARGFLRSSLVMKTLATINNFKAKIHVLPGNGLVVGKQASSIGFGVILIYSFWFVTYRRRESKSIHVTFSLVNDLKF
jgi:hypothetical protein